MENASRHIGRRIGGKDQERRRMCDNRESWKSRELRNSERSEEEEGKWATKGNKTAQESNGLG